MIEITAVGGYNEIGRNCTAVKIDDEVIILDMGFHMENYVKYSQDHEFQKFTATELVRENAIPNVDTIKDWTKKVKAIIVSHAHLDHIGAVPYLAGKYPCPVISTPFTTHFLKTLLKDDKMKLQNRLIGVNVNQKYRISKKITVEFVNITHSIPQTALVVLHTPYGQVVYGLDYKLDNYPTLGQKPNYKRIKELKEVKVFISECLYADVPQKMPSESVAKQMLREVLFDFDYSGSALFVTTFASHIARIKSIVEFGRKLRRKVVFIGRSLKKYSKTAESVGICSFKDVKAMASGKQGQALIKKIVKEGKDKYLFIVTGHQGEPQATLSRMVDGDYNFPFTSRDVVIFSSSTIPSPTNIENRKILERKLQKLGIRMFVDIHVSGHAAKEDIRELISLLKPKNLVPAHAGGTHLKAFMGLAKEMGYIPKKTVHNLQLGQRIQF